MRILCVLLPHFPWRCEVRRHPDIEGRLTRREGTCNVVINQVKPFNALDKVPASKDWR